MATRSQLVPSAPRSRFRSAAECPQWSQKLRQPVFDRPQGEAGPFLLLAGQPAWLGAVPDVPSAFIRSRSAGSAYGPICVGSAAAASRIAVARRCSASGALLNPSSGRSGSVVALKARIGELRASVHAGHDDPRVHGERCRRGFRCAVRAADGCSSPVAPHRASRNAARLRGTAPPAERQGVRVARQQKAAVTGEHPKTRHRSAVSVERESPSVGINRRSSHSPGIPAAQSPPIPTGTPERPGD
ncbi:hypothetical protein A4R44_08069 [Amycolatopsis sp. M39]|nr:hypothetical protein A4R44_08069 [Amycolatopsis sp. M39]